MDEPSSADVFSLLGAAWLTLRRRMPAADRRPRSVLSDLSFRSGPDGPAGSEGLSLAILLGAAGLIFVLLGRASANSLLLRPGSVWSAASWRRSAARPGGQLVHVLVERTVPGSRGTRVYGVISVRSWAMRPGFIRSCVRAPWILWRGRPALRGLSRWYTSFPPLRHGVRVSRRWPPGALLGRPSARWRIAAPTRK